MDAAERTLLAETVGDAVARAPDDADRVLAELGWLEMLAAEPDVNRPQHIVQDFEPTFERLRSLGFTEVWRDAWLWGHRVFQKA